MAAATSSDVLAEAEHALTEDIIVTPGDEICRAAGFVRGHGTFVREGSLIASVAGVVHRVNRVVSVRPVSSRYVGEVGDVVVGRVTEVGAKRWRVDIHGRQDAVLLLSGLYMGETAQRRLTAEDQLGMRKHLQEGDIVSADIHTFFSDGGVSLHARSGQYGRLANGCAVAVPPFLVHRLSAHFVTLPCDVDCVIGMNGVVWLSESVPEGELEAAIEAEKTAGRTSRGSGGVSAGHRLMMRRQVAALRSVSAEGRRRVARVRGCVAALGWGLLPVTPASIMRVYGASEASGISASSLSDPAVMGALLRTAMPDAGGTTDDDVEAAADRDVMGTTASSPRTIVKL